MSANTEKRHGSCLCGAAQYEISGPPRWRLYCHCTSCRINCASPVTAFFGMANDSWTWVGEPPAVYESSPGVKRHFCSTCGTPMAFEATHYPGEIHFYTVHLNDPSGFEPDGHVHADERLDWFDVADNAPRWVGSHGSALLDSKK